MSGGSAIRGSRVGAGPMGEAERGEAAPREYVSYFCANHHVIRPAFAAEAAAILAEALENLRQRRRDGEVIY